MNTTEHQLELREQLSPIVEYLEMMDTLMKTRPMPAGFLWANPHEFILKNGREMKPAVLAKKLGPPKHCFSTSAVRVLRTRSDTLVYCEGMVIAEKVPFPLEHGWLFDTERNCVVETTLREPGIEYFGIAFTREYLREGLRGRSYSGLISAWDRDYPLLRMSPEELEKAIHPSMKGST
jgi:hypothetical protein